MHSVGNISVLGYLTPITYMFGQRAAYPQAAEKSRKNIKRFVEESENVGIRHLTVLHSSHIIMGAGNDTTAALFGHA
jgi:hypothetical protein